MGTLPAELGNLALVERLGFERNNLVGSIPPEIGNLRHLTWFTAGKNQLSGVIPAALANLTNLAVVDLVGNDLTCMPQAVRDAWSSASWYVVDNDLATCVDEPTATATNTATFTPIPPTATPTGIPANLTVSVQTNSIVLDWDAPSVAPQAYQVLRRAPDDKAYRELVTISVAGKDDPTTYTDTTVNQVGAYSYTVKSMFNGGSLSEMSEPVTAQVRQADLATSTATNTPIPPTATPTGIPANLTVSVQTNSIVLDWDAPSVAPQTYQVERRVLGVLNGEEYQELVVITVAGGNAPTTYTDTTVSRAGEYVYIVRSRFTNGTYSEASEPAYAQVRASDLATSTPLQSDTPTATDTATATQALKGIPFNLNVNVQKNSIVLDWDAPLVAPQGYQVLRRAPDDKAYRELVTISVAGKDDPTTYTDTTVNQVGAYSYTVKSMFNGGSLSEMSEPVTAQVRQADLATSTATATPTDTETATASPTDTATSTSTSTATLTPAPRAGCKNVGPGTYWLFPSSGFLSGAITIYLSDQCDAAGSTTQNIGADGYVYSADGQSVAEALCVAGHGGSEAYIAQQQILNPELWACQEVPPTATDTAIPTDTSVPSATDTPMPPSDTPVPTSGAATAPGKPTNLSALVAVNGILLSWTAPSDDIDGYQILRRRPRRGEGQLLIHVDNTGNNDTSYLDTKVSGDDEIYAYRVKAIRAGMLGSRSSFINVEVSPGDFLIVQQEPTVTPIPPTSTPVPPTNTLVPPTYTQAPPTNTLVPPTNTLVPPTNTLVPPTNTAIPPTNTQAPALGPRDIANVVPNGDPNGALDVTWTVPSEFPVDYRINWAEQDEPYPTWTDLSGNAFPTVNAHTITGLSPDVCYKVQVRARYGGSAGDWTEVKSMINGSC